MKFALGRLFLSGYTKPRKYRKTMTGINFFKLEK